MKISTRNLAKVLLLSLVIIPFARAEDAPSESRGPYSYTELVLAPHAVVTATTEFGTMKIEAVDVLTRKYTWEGASRSARLWPRQERWYGSLGAYFPGPGDHWKIHNGITRGCLEEGQQKFSSEAEALTWLRTGYNQLGVYRDDGLVVVWSKNLDRRQLNVNVWQVLINGKTPQHLPGSHNDKIKLSGKEVATGG
jgi:hypothetical protein